MLYGFVPAAAFEDALPLHAFIRQEPNLTFDERLGILQQIVEAVAHCHRSGVLHRNLSPASVLVRRGPDGRIHVRLHRFQTAAWIEHSSVGTRHFHDLAHILFDQALLAEGGQLDDPAGYVSRVNKLLVA